MLTIQEVVVPAGEGQAWEAEATARSLLGGELAPPALIREDDRHGRENTMWLGSEETLRRFGLTRGAPVTDWQLARALRGVHASTGAEILPPRDWGLSVSLHLTFSAPNSVSWVWVQGDPEVRDQLEYGMLSGANVALGYVLECMQEKLGPQAAQDHASATILHVMAGEAPGDVPPPLLHVHCQMIAVSDARGALHRPDPAALPDHTSRLCGAAGRLKLSETVRALGFGIRAGTSPSRRYFEIEGVPEGLLRPEISIQGRCNGPVQETLYGQPPFEEWD